MVLISSSILIFGTIYEGLEGTALWEKVFLYVMGFEVSKAHTRLSQTLSMTDIC